jgi:hypothetical protein
MIMTVEDILTMWIVMCSVFGALLVIDSYKDKKKK